MRILTVRSCPLRRMLVVWAALLVVGSLATSTAAPAPKKAPRGKKPSAPSLPPPEMDRNASRFILPENQATYLEKMRARTSMSKRITDPFGRYQDPDAAPAPVAQPGPGGKNGTRPPPQKIAPLQQALANLKVTTIIPGENRFLVGSRSYRKGELIPFKLRGKVMNVEVVSVSSAQIVFRNSETKETATMQINMLPPGMQPGTTLSETPGLFRSQKDAPINLDSPNSP